MGPVHYGPTTSGARNRHRHPRPRGDAIRDSCGSKTRDRRGGGSTTPRPLFLFSPSLPLFGGDRHRRRRPPHFAATATAAAAESAPVCCSKVSRPAARSGARHGTAAGGFESFDRGAIPSRVAVPDLALVSASAARRSEPPQGFGLPPLSASFASRWSSLRLSGLVSDCWLPLSFLKGLC